MEGASHRLLIVDDDPDIRQILSRRLGAQGFVVREATDGDAALKALGQSASDLVLLDIMMPRRSGMMVLEEIRRSYSPVELPVIMLTAKAEPGDVVGALEKGANDYVTKPFDFGILIARIEAQLRTAEAGRVSAFKEVLTPLPGTILPGMVLADRYRLESMIGAGQFGAVYRAFQLDLNRPVAIKVLKTRTGQEAEQLARFRQEAIVSCRVRHPNAVTMLDFVLSRSGVAFLVMELLEGIPLAVELEMQAGPLTAERVAQVMAPACDAVAEAHDSGVVHRDLKPGNIFLHQSPRGEIPKVLDFGLATLAHDVASDPRVTPENIVLGTPAYMAPERFRAGPTGAPADVYALGCSLYQLLSGKLPFHAPGKEPLALAVLHIRKEATPILELNPAIPDLLASTVHQCMRKRPETRPTARRLSQVLRMFEPTASA